MKKHITLALVLAASAAQAQYFQHWYNRSLNPGLSSNETFYDGLRTRVNYSGGNPVSYYNIGYGATMISPFGALATDEARFVRTNKAGTVVNVNTGASFADNNTTLFHFSYGHAICEINNAAGTGGYLAVGNVASNFLNGSVVPGGSDGLFYKMNNAGAPASRFRFDSNGGAEYFTDIIASTFNPGTYYVCGYAHYNGYDDAIVMSIQVNGTVNWFKRYQFDPTWPASAVTASAECRAYGIAEDINTGSLMVVGYIHDQVPAPSTGTDGLVFVVNNAGNVICAQLHHVYDNDQYHDVKQKANGDFAICGFVEDGTGGTAFSHTWLSEMSVACGNFTSTRYDHALGGNINQSKGFSIIERLNTANVNEYYIAGPDISSAGIVASVSKITAVAGNPPVAWYDYAGQSGNFFDDAYSIDYATAASTKPGLLLFSNTNAPPATAPFNDSYMLKAYFNGASCINDCNSNNLLQSPLPVAVTFLPDSIRTVYKRKPMIAQVTNYTFGVICAQNAIGCGSNARTVDAEELSDLNDENNFIMYPNPADDLINMAVIISNEGNYSITAIDIMGREIPLTDQYLTKGRQIISVDLSGLAKGIYTMKATSNNQTFSKKFVVK